MTFGLNFYKLLTSTSILANVAVEGLARPRELFCKKSSIQMVSVGRKPRMRAEGTAS